MKSLAVVFVIGLVMVIVGSCGDSEQALGLNEDQQLQVHSTQAVGAEGLVGPQEGVIFIAIPEVNYVRGIYDPWTCDLVLSMLPEAARGQLGAKGVISSMMRRRPLRSRSSPECRIPTYQAACG